MNRLIDTMTKSEIEGFLDNLCPFSDAEVKQGLEKLFAPVPNWSDNLSPMDDQTWVFCFVSDDSPEDTRYAEWIEIVSIYGYRARASSRSWKYATPVDLDLRYTKGEATL